MTEKEFIEKLNNNGYEVATVWKRDNSFKAVIFPRGTFYPTVDLLRTAIGYDDYSIDIFTQDADGVIDKIVRCL